MVFIRLIQIKIWHPVLGLRPLSRSSRVHHGQFVFLLGNFGVIMEELVEFTRLMLNHI